MGGYGMVTEAQARATMKYQKKTYDRFTVRIRKDSGLKDIYQDYADSLDMTVSTFAVKAMSYIVEHKIKLK